MSANNCQWPPAPCDDQHGTLLLAVLLYQLDLTRLHATKELSRASPSRLSELAGDDLQADGGVRGSE